MQANCLRFFIKWKGYGYKENFWENKGDVKAPELIADFYHLHLGAPRCIRSIIAATFHNLVPVPPVSIHVLGHHILDGG